MKKKIGIIPTIIQKNKSIHICLDSKLISFVKKCFPKYEYDILLDTKIKVKLDLIISSGGNSITSLENNNANKFRKKLDDFYFKYVLKNNLSYLGICHGAQYLAKFFKSKIEKRRNHVGANHFIKTYYGRKKTVNSYHNFVVIKLGKNLKKIASAPDGTLEAFKHSKKKILGIMWHPERYNKIKKFDLNFIKQNL
jgi:putative glutamine amidotransferase